MFLELIIWKNIVSYIKNGIEFPLPDDIDVAMFLNKRKPYASWRVDYIIEDIGHLKNVKVMLINYTHFSIKFDTAQATCIIDVHSD